MNNKLVPLVILCLCLSIVLVRYLANRSSEPLRSSSSSTTLEVGTNAEYAPFSFMSHDAITGFDIDLINDVAKRMDKKVVLHDMPFDSLIPAVQIGTIPVIIGGLTPTKERMQRVLFTKPYLSNDPLMIISPAIKPVTSTAELSGKNIAVNEGYTADYYISKLEGPTVTRFATPIELFMALESGQADAIVIARNSVAPFIKHYGTDKFSVAEIPDTNEEYAIAVSKKHPELLPLIQKALDDMTSEGVLESLKKKWNLS